MRFTIYEPKKAFGQAEGDRCRVSNFSVAGELSELTASFPADTSSPLMSAGMGRSFGDADGEVQKMRITKLKSEVGHHGSGLMRASCVRSGVFERKYMIFRGLSPFFTYLTPCFTLVFSQRCLIFSELEKTGGVNDISIQIQCSKIKMEARFGQQLHEFVRMVCRGKGAEHEIKIMIKIKRQSSRLERTGMLSPHLRLKR